MTFCFSVAVYVLHTVSLSLSVKKKKKDFCFLLVDYDYFSLIIGIETFLCVPAKLVFICVYK